MKRIFAAFVAVCMFSVANAQMVTGENRGDYLASDIFYQYIKDKAVSEVSVADQYTGVEGSPYLFEDWAYARIKLVDNRRFDSILVKINLFENEVYFKDPSEKVRQLAVQAKEIEIRDARSKYNNVIFVSGYGKNEKTFYQVVADGKKVGLIKELKIFKKETKIFNAPTKKSFELGEGDLILYSKGSSYIGTKSCDGVIQAFAYDKKLASYLESNDIKCNKEKDLKKLVEYYNSY